MNRAGDFVSRLLVLVLAGVGTLSIIASLVSVSQLPERPVAQWSESQEPNGATAASDAGAPVEADRPDAVEPDAAPTMNSFSAALTPISEAGEQARIADWLKALTYAAIALAGFAAAALVVLLRISSALVRLTDRG